MATPARHLTESDTVKALTQNNYLFRDLDEAWLTSYLSREDVQQAKLYASRPIYTAFQKGEPLDVLYAIVTGGPVVVRSTPLDRVIGVSYPGSCFGMQSLPFSYGLIGKAFPSLVEAYKTTDVVKIPLETVQALYEDSEVFRLRYDLLFELQQKFQYHLLNCSTYPPQAVAALLRALVYQERELGNQPESNGIYVFDLPMDVIARASQLNHRTVEQVLKGMRQVKLLASPKSSDPSSDTVKVIDAEGLKETYSATRDKVHWWPLRDK
ncbi:Crp/Fnr family transcriptional regulator [Gloeocapsopsis dulcis]|uniref:cAMP-binding protein n=1 Tax=Gloeocapsopsis dulcis AAB1 = 1H9 TaxID=1433147 RepID=A0A6N8FS64_9CHRO|nr:Crp/Fnr family transcriptional regulator [Gloeocapsopsis dulcis]MUL35402.1 cAMP-binding protein [Gloeocapsopsis dulcis AAB1 = 1H9]WNN90401.1 Crp/Fnr family transcriptional regulator [Gloeocapsopsis dulcis]